MSINPKAGQSIWVFPDVSFHLVKQLSNELNIHPAIAQVLISRGLKSR
jgi:hypothetical protein